MRVSVFNGDICDAPAEAICTSTNPRLSLVMGTGASVRARGGIEILRACERIAPQPAGSAHVTTAGALPAKIVVHCVASDAAHRSSPSVVRACVRNAVNAAVAAGCRSIAMPLFATGHAHLAFTQSVQTMADTLREMQPPFEQIFIVVYDAERVEEVRDVFAL